MGEDTKVRIVLLPVPIVGHMISMIEMAKRLLLSQHHRRNLSITVLTMPILGPLPPAVSTYMDSVAATSGLDIHFDLLPQLDDPSTLDFNISIGTIISEQFDRYKSHVRNALAGIMSTKTPVSAVILDFFATPVIDALNGLGVPPYVYFTSGAACLGLMINFPALDARYPKEYAEVEEGICLPGFTGLLPPVSLPDFFVDKKDPVYDWFVLHGRRFLDAKGLIVNTFTDLQPAVIQALMEGRFSQPRPTPPVYPVGPLLFPQENPSSGRAGDHECVRWLDRQPPGSVVFLCFGSNGSFSVAQCKEIARGLENSGHRFLWAVRTRGANGAFGALSDADLDQVLPEGFLERTRGRGLVWPKWAPQVEVLSHPATGAFVTHCGWNSFLESVWYGVPVVCWPLYAEQHLNAFEIAREIGVGVEVELDRKGGNFVVAEELERKVRSLMDKGGGDRGKSVREKVKAMKAASRKALDDGGSSSICIGRLAEELCKWSSGAANTYPA